MDTIIIDGKAEFVKEKIDELIAAGKTIDIVTRLEAGKTLVVFH